MLLRRATLRDEDAIVTLDQELFYRDIIDLLDVGGLRRFQALVAVAPSGDLAGYVVYQGCPEDRCIDLWSIGVAGEHRGQGVGRMLLAALREVLARWTWATRIEAPVSETNMDAAKFFAACGWQSRLDREFYGPGREDAYLFEWRA